MTNYISPQPFDNFLEALASAAYKSSDHILLRCAPLILLAKNTSPLESTDGG